MESREAEDQHFPSHSSLHLAEEAHLEMPAEAIQQHGANGAIRLVFCLYDKMKRVLPSSTNGVKSSQVGL